jgi:peptidoglycan-N-acetylglucosamine deacetylase
MIALRTLTDSMNSENSLKSLYLTFDDGPDPGSTERVLELLGKKGIQATFFVIALQARAQLPLLRKIQSAGHTIGNHSLDHRYWAFFAGKQKMIRWISDSEKMISDLIGHPTVGFRPPAGIQTPELHKALNDLSMPLILWNVRFYDAIFQWTPERALRSLKKTAPGSIVLLHDRQAPHKISVFLDTLSDYIEEAQKKNFVSKALTRGTIMSEPQFKNNLNHKLKDRS